MSLSGHGTGSSQTCFEINSTRLARFHQSDIRLGTVLCLTMPITEGVILLFDAVSSYDGPSLRRRSNHSSPSLLIPGRGQQKDSFPRSNRLGEKPLVIFFFHRPLSRIRPCAILPSVPTASASLPRLHCGTNRRLLRAELVSCSRL